MPVPATVSERLQIVMSRRVSIAACSLSLLAACSTDEPTEIVAGVSTQMRVPEGIKGVGLRVVGDGVPLFCEHYPVVDGVARLPATLGVLKRASGNLLTVTVFGFRTAAESFSTDCFEAPNINANAEVPNEIVVMRRRRLPFLSDRILFLPLPLKESCGDVQCDNEDETCIGGACVAAELDPAGLPEYKDSLIFGDTSTCFDPALCMPASGTLPVVLADPADCTFHVDWPTEEPLPSDGLNVRVLYSSMGSEILDLDSLDLTEDQHEGISLPDPDDSLTFRLAPNLCETNYKLDKILGLEASPFCPGKRPFQPLCDSALAVNPDDPNGLGIGGTSAAAKPSTCTLGALASVESAAYVLMDRSSDMFEFFGDGGLRFAVELPLSNPVARGTRMAFGLLPADVAQCDVAPIDNDFLTPDILFGDVSDVRTPIGDLLGDPANVLADSPPVYMEAAMEGAYQALTQLMPRPGSVSSRFNRKALVVIGNRGFFETCPTDGVTPAQRALAAFNSPDPIYTYAVVLENELDPAKSDLEVPEATSIALNGGTEVFNGVADEAEGAAAVQKVLNDLGSCMYEVRNPLTGSPALPDSATISYVNPLLPIRETIDIPHNPDCNDAEFGIEGSDVSGWAQDQDDLVRICGQACDDLRDTLDVIAGINALENRVPPSIPLVASGACPEDGEFRD